jgi:hypothetical protein
MNETKTINLTIKRDGEYSVKDNIEFKARSIVRNQLPIVANTIDHFFTDFGR